MKFFKEDLVALVYSDHTDCLELIEDTHESSRRWVEERRLVFRDTETGKLFAIEYEKGLTEIQDDMRAFEYDHSEIECQEVELVEVIGVRYEAVTYP